MLDDPRHRTLGRTATALPPGSRRRDFLRFALAAAALCAPPLDKLFGSAEAQAASPLTTTPLRDGLITVGGAGGNVVLLKTASAAALVDSGAPEHATALSALVRAQLAGMPLGTLLNTHWHPAATGGNDAFGGAGTKIVAHENTRLWMATEYYVDWEDKTYAPRAAAALPTLTFHSSDPQPITLKVGDERIEYGHLQEAHTDGDIYVFFRERNVLVAGGAVAVGAYPVIDYATGGWIGGLVDSNAKLLNITNANTLIVPHDGPAQPRNHLEAQLDMLKTVRGRIENLMRKGKSIAEMLAADVTAGFDPTWGANRERFVANIYNGLWWAGRLGESL
jgi:glyoxylase-like metal-dependent hydrolase (beta-lactamase superfamily II)